jgi:preprotein translocase SecE subunit
MNVQEKRESHSLPSMKKAYQFLENVKAEFRKIQWTDGEEVKVYAKVVVFATFILGMAIYFTDLIIQKTLVVVEMIFKLLFG